MRRPIHNWATNSRAPAQIPTDQIFSAVITPIKSFLSACRSDLICLHADHIFSVCMPIKSHRSDLFCRDHSNSDRQNIQRCTRSLFLAASLHHGLCRGPCLRRQKQIDLHLPCHVFCHGLHHVPLLPRHSPVERIMHNIEPMN